MQIIIREDGQPDEIYITISNRDKQIMEYDVTSFRDWIKKSLASTPDKIEGCRERLIKQYKPIIAAENSMIPSRDCELCDMIFVHPSYKNRRTRDLEAAQTTPTETPTQPEEV